MDHMLLFQFEEALKRSKMLNQEAPQRPDVLPARMMCA